MVVNKSLLITGLLIAAAASQAGLMRERLANLSSTQTRSEILLAQRSCNPNDPSYCP